MNLPIFTNDKDQYISQLFAWFTLHGATHYDESVSQLEHALQCATLAEAQDEKPEQVVAALVHDIGHLLINEHNQTGYFLENDGKHELAGSLWAARFFGPAVVDPIRLHVPAKRWLYTRDAHYHDHLSPSSVRSLKLQGGKMSKQEQEEFEREPYYQEAIRLRIRDDNAKVKGLKTPDLEFFRRALVSCFEDYKT